MGGRIEITSPVNLLKAGDKVGNSEAVLLQKLHINPFDYGLVITDVYDNGSIFDVKVLDLTDDDLFFKFGNALGAISSVCLQTSYPSIVRRPTPLQPALKLWWQLRWSVGDILLARLVLSKLISLIHQLSYLLVTEAVRKTQRRLKNRKRRRRRRRLTWVAAWTCLAVMVVATTIEYKVM